MAEQDDPLAGTEFAGGNIPGAAKSSSTSAGSQEDPLAGTEFAKSVPNGGARPTSASSTAPQPKIAQKSAEEYANMPIGDVLSEAASNLGPSAMTAYQGLAHAVTNPTETLGALGQIGTGLYSKAQGALGVQQNAAEKAKTEALVNALGQHYGETYGSVGGLKKAVATDPFSVGMDVASVVPVVGPGARALGLTGETAGMLGKAASVAGSAASAMDPVQLALNVGKGAAGMGTKVADIGLTGAQATMTDTPQTALRVARAAGSSTDPQATALFKQFASDPDHTQLVQTAMDAMQEKKDAFVQNYLKSKDNFALATQQLPMDEIVAALEKLKESKQYGAGEGRFGSSQSYIADIENQINQTIQSQRPTSKTILDLDNLKQSIRDTADTAPQGIRKPIQAVATAVRDTIAKQDPKYAEAMEAYSRGLDEQKNFAAQFGLRANGASNAAYAKLMKAPGSVPGKAMLEDLSSTEAGKYLPYMLAGSAINPWLASGIASKFEYPALIGTALMNPSMLPHALAGAAATSPRLAGMSQYAVGRAQRALKPLSDAASTAVSQPVTYGLTRVGETEQKLQASGGRIGRATGGRAQGAMTADMLIAAAERAKKNDGKATSSLLDQPDEAITRALAIANKNI
jgi:hypothetical protein